MNEKDKVLSIYPTAFSEADYEVATDSPYPDPEYSIYVFLGRGGDEEKAWIDAASRLALSHSGEELSKSHIGQRVRVNHERFHGEGILKKIDEPTPRVAWVELEHGEDRWYEADTVVPIESAESTANANTTHHYIRDGYRGRDAIDTNAPKVVSLPPTPNYSIDQLRKAEMEMKREAYQGYFLLSRNERESQLLESLRREEEFKELLRDCMKLYATCAGDDCDSNLCVFNRIRQALKEKVGAR